MYIYIEPEWLKIFHHNTIGGLFPTIESAVNMNTDNENAKLFSILDQIESYRSSSSLFHFKLCYPDLNDLCNEWTQASNPVTDQIIKNFTAINIQSNIAYNFSGLGLDISAYNNLMDSQPASPRYWWYSVGTIRWYNIGTGDTIPGPAWEETREVVLYLKKGMFPFPVDKFTFVSQDFDSNVESLEECRSRCLASGWCEGFTWVKDNPKNGLEKKDVSYANHSSESAWSGFLSCK